MKISLGILCYNGWKYTDQLITDIKNNCQNANEVIVMDNASTEVETKLGLFYWNNSGLIPNMRVFHLTENAGFPGGMNALIPKFMLDTDVIVLLSNDVRILSSDFIKEIEKDFTVNENILLGPTLYTQSTGWNVFDGVTIPYVEGYCLAAKRDFWYQTGGFDTIYSPSDFEDVDLSMTAVGDFGMDLKQMRPGLVQHLGGKTLGYSEERAARTTRNRRLFAEKWSLKDDWQEK